jgi:hypothetical protein
MRRIVPGLQALLALLAVAACPGGAEDLPPFQDGPPPGTEASVEDQGLPGETPVVYHCDTIDTLFVIDNSNSMEQEQGNLVENFAKFIEAIETIQPPIKSYHVGVISTDMGAGPFSGPLVGPCVPGGDEGKLQHAPAGGGCAPSYPKFLEGPSDTLAQDFGCIAKLGLGGCGYEQQMEAALKALTAQPYNDGFVRKTAPLAIIFISDEDDCSAKDTGLFDPENSALGAQPTRCVQHTDKLHPVAHYVQQLQGLKDNPKRLVVAAITGPPGNVEIDPVLNKVLPICSSPEFGSSHPGNRFDTLVKAFGERGVLESLCQGDLAAPLQVIGKAIERVCLE